MEIYYSGLFFSFNSPLSWESRQRKLNRHWCTSLLVFEPTRIKYLIHFSRNSSPTKKLSSSLRRLQRSSLMLGFGIFELWCCLLAQFFFDCQQRRKTRNGFKSGLGAQKQRSHFSSWAVSAKGVERTRSQETGRELSDDEYTPTVKASWRTNKSPRWRKYDLQEDLGKMPRRIRENN